MEKTLIDLEDELREESAKLRLAIEYALPIIGKNADYGQETELAIDLTVSNFFAKLKEVTDKLNDIWTARKGKALDADLIDFCSHKNCPYDNQSSNKTPICYCTECTSRYTKDANGNLRDRHGDIIPIRRVVTVTEEEPILKIGEPIGG